MSRKQITLIDSMNNSTTYPINIIISEEVRKPNAEAQRLASIQASEEGSLSSNISNQHLFTVDQVNSNEHL